MTFLLIASGFAVLVGIAMIARRRDVIGLSSARGTHLGRLIGGSTRRSGPDVLTVTGRTQLHSDRRMLATTRRRR